MFYDDVPEGAEVYIRGAYFMTAEKEGKPPIDFYIVDPTKKVIYSRRRKNDGIFRINATVPGAYSFIFSNRRVHYIKALIEDCLLV
jgi:hypothetical protein